MIDLDAIHRAAPAPLELAERLGLEVARGSRRDRARIRCPAHAERRPSCDVAMKGGRLVWCCRSCGAGGGLFDLVAAVEGLSVARDFPEVAKRAAELVGVDIEHDERQRRQHDPAVTLAQAIDAAAADWLAGRTIGRADAERIEGASAEQIADALADLRAASRSRRVERRAA